MSHAHGSQPSSRGSSEHALAFEPGITLDRVRFGYDGRRTLDGITLDLPLGSNVVITGKNGAGKSTLLYVAAALLRPDAGTLLLGGQRVDSMLPSERFRRGLRVGFVFQEGGLIANLSAWDNVALPLRYHADVLGVSEADIETRVRTSLERVGLGANDVRQLPAHLSVGNRKRVALARALAVEPRYFFFDDPDVGLDPDTARLIHEILCAMRDDPRVTLMVATNRALLIERLGVRGLRLAEGKLRDAGPLPTSSLVPPAPPVPRT
jgi:ABC-type transporter Mla maintaining outer membrane lipid asymmetry ATPase subunit MlaF